MTGRNGKNLAVQSVGVPSMGSDFANQMNFLMTTNVEDEAMFQKAQKAIEEIAESYKPIAERIAMQNKKARTISDSVKNFRSQSGFFAKGKAFGGILGATIDNTPVVGYVKHYIGKSMTQGENSVHDALMQQYKTVYDLKDRTHEVLYGDALGTKTIISSLGQTIETLLSDIGNIREGKDKLLEDIQGKEKEGKLLDKIRAYEEKYSTTFNSVPVSGLNTKETKDYANLMVKYNELQRLYEELDSKKRQEKSAVNKLTGKQITLASVVVYHARGTEIYDRVCSLLDGAEQDFQATFTMIQSEEVFVGLARVTAQLRDNYNSIREESTRHAKVLAEQGDYLVAEDINKVGSLERSAQNITSAIMSYTKDKGPAAIARLREVSGNMIGYNPEDKTIDARLINRE